MWRTVASASAVPRARSVVPATAQPAPSNGARPPSGTVMRGWRLNASWGCSGSRVVAPEQWPTRGAGLLTGIARAAARISPSGTQRRTTSACGLAPRPSGPSTSTPASRSAAARACPSRPAPTMAQRCGSAEGIRSSSRTRYRLGWGGGTVVFAVHPVVVTAADTMLPRRERVPTWARAVPVANLEAMRSAEQRREELKAVYREASGCTRCPQLAATRHTVVFGSGHADADLMFVGEAPGANEDKQGVPFVGQAGKLLDQP